MKLKLIMVAAAISLVSPEIKADLNETVRASEGSGNVYSRSRLDGEYDLVNIASSSCNDDIWIYVSGKWYDVGINNNREAAQLDMGLIERILNETSGNIYDYKIQHSQSCNTGYSERISLQPASLGSLFSHVSLSELVRSNGRNLYSRVVDEHGIWRYSISNRLAENIIELNAGALGAVEDAISEASGWLLDIPRAILDLRLREYQMKMQTSGVYVSYRMVR